MADRRIVFSGIAARHFDPRRSCLTGTSVRFQLAGCLVPVVRHSGVSLPHDKPTGRPRYVSPFRGRIVTPRYLKAINNPEGQHTLACEWLGTFLARRFGLATFDLTVLEVTEDDEIPLLGDLHAAPGPAVVSRYEKGGTMGQQRSLEQVHNRDDIDPPPGFVPGLD